MENDLDMKLVQGDDDDLVGSKLIQYDGISVADRTNINDQD